MLPILRPVIQCRNGYCIHYDEYVEKRVFPKTDKQSWEIEAKEEKQPSHKQALKRFNHYISNFALLFKSGYRFNKNGMNLMDKKGIIHLHKPTMITLTVPKQEVSDKSFKRDVLNRLVLIFKRKFGVKVYIWKAEAQKRGAIHFHFVVDRFINAMVIRQYWFNILKDFKCINKNSKVEECSRIVHCKMIKNLNTMEVELTSYFDLKYDEKGNLIHKHDRTKRVRAIDGKFYGCSDNIRYGYFLIEDDYSIGRCPTEKPLKIDIISIGRANILIAKFREQEYCKINKVWTTKYVNNVFDYFNELFHFVHFEYIFREIDMRERFFCFLKEFKVPALRYDFSTFPQIDLPEPVLIEEVSLQEEIKESFVQKILFVED